MISKQTDDAKSLKKKQNSTFIYPSWYNLQAWRTGCETGCHHYKQPTIIKWDLIKSSRHNGLRDSIMARDQNRTMISGGIHLTHGAFLPTTIIKDFSASEEDFFLGAVNWAFLLTATLQQLNLEQRRIYEGFYRPFEQIALG